MRKPLAVQMNKESAWKKEMGIMADYAKHDKSSREYNKSVSMNQQIRALHNCAVNRPIIVDRIKKGTAHDLSTEPYKPGKTVVLVSSGPSLDQHIPFLQKWKGDIICMWQQATTLIYYGIVPNYIMVTDIRSTYEGIEGIDWSKYNTKLIATPGCWKSIFERWPNDLLLYRLGNGESQGFHKFTQNIMYSNTQDTHVESLKGEILLTPMIPTEITIYASGASSVVALASGLQYSKVILCGFDFCEHSNKRRFTKWDKSNGTWMKSVSEIDWSVEQERVGDVVSNNIYRYYKRQFLAACRFSQRIIYTMDLTPSPFPVLGPEKTLRGKLPKYNKPHIDRLIDDYLAEGGMYPIECKHGFIFYELDSYEKIIQAMTLQNRVYRCDNCQSAFQFTDDADYTGYDCDNCKIGKLSRNAPVDIKKNAKRLKRYFKETK